MAGRNKDAVNEPTFMSEFEVQAFLWSELRELGFNLRGEVKTKFAHRCYVRFDLALFEDGKLTGIIEVKKSPMKHKSSWEETRQGIRYNDFGVPVKIVYGHDQAKSLVHDAAKTGKIF